MNKKSSGIVCLAFLALAFQASSVSASVIYEYVGNPYTEIYSGSGSEVFNSSMSISGYIELDNPLPTSLDYYGDAWESNIAPISFSFSDGVSVYTDQNVTSYIFDLQTDENGNITAWYVDLAIGGTGHTVGEDFVYIFVVGNYPDWGGAINNYDQGTLQPCEQLAIGYYGDPYCTGHLYYGSNASPGSWSIATAVVPVPSAFWLLGSGLIGLIGLARRKSA